MHFEQIDTGKATFEVMRTSEKAPEIVVLPGAGGGIRDYAELCLELDARGYSTMGINPRTSGASSGPVEGLTFQDLAIDVIDVIERVGVGPVLLAGHAGGNRIARMAATLRPELFFGIVLVAAGGKVPPDPEAMEAMRGIASDSLSGDELINAVKTAFLAPTSEVGDAYLKLGDRSPTFLKAFITAIETTPAEEWWAGGGARMLVIQGKQDRMAPVANGHQLRDQFPDRVHCVDLDDAGHALHLEKPDEVSRLIAEFARKIT
jgi:pimeloyl-ACP methyl ester carboxylesterase